jgi:primosomal protein N' (replication factor Y)
MVTKGLDFDHVQVVGVLSADSMLSYPDFRAHERGFQLMAQVSGRAGRKNQQGQVIIQAWKPKHPVLQLVVNNDYVGMYQVQIYERQKFNYPPFYRLIIVRLKHKDANLLNAGASSLAVEYRKKFGKLVLGPEYPLVSKVRNYFIKHILIKFPRQADSYHIKKQMLDSADHFKTNSQFRPIIIQYDVDPQ